MRAISRRVLASDATSRIEGAVCAGQGPTWDGIEAAHRNAGTPARSREIVVRTINDWCGSCPALLGCHRWARAEGYTGLAAGAAYRDGERMPAEWRMPRNGAGQEAS